MRTILHSMRAEGCFGDGGRVPRERASGWGMRFGGQRWHGSVLRGIGGGGELGKFRWFVDGDLSEVR